MLNGLFAIWSPVIYRKYLRQCYKSVLLGWYTLQQIYWYTLVQNAWYTLLQIIQNPFPVDLVTLFAEIVHDFPTAIKWMPGVLFINQFK